MALARRSVTSPTRDGANMRPRTFLIPVKAATVRRQHRAQAAAHNYRTVLSGMKIGSYKIVYICILG